MERVNSHFGCYDCDRVLVLYSMRAHGILMSGEACKNKTSGDCAGIGPIIFIVKFTLK